MGRNWDHMGWWGMGWGWLFFALLLLGIAVLVVVLIRALGGRGQQQGPGPTGRNRAREILDERYARGEIDATEYDERRRRIDGGSET